MTINNYDYKLQADPAAYAVDTSGSNNIIMGDMVYWYQAGPYVKSLANGQEALFVGVAEGVAPTPAGNIDNTTGLISKVLVRQKGIFALKTTVGETYTHGNALKCGADAQTVTNSTVALADTIGYVWRPDGTAALTGAAGVTVDVAIVQRYPASGLDIL